MKKIAVITGGSGGIGSAVCRRLADDGYFVVVNYFRSQEKAEKIASDIGGISMKFNVAVKNEVTAAFDLINKNFGAPQLLVNNSGISEINLFTHIPQDIADNILDVNLKGALNCSRSALPFMISRKSGNIINISSMWGECGASCEVDYSASKAGIIGFTKALAKEVAPSGIRVNCVSPGFILTEMNRSFSPEDLELIKEDIPLGFFGKPEHIANAVAFLTSQEAEYITGQVLSVNGGMII